MHQHQAYSLIANNSFALLLNIHYDLFSQEYIQENKNTLL